MEASDKIFDEIVTELGKIKSATEQLREAKTRTDEVLNQSILVTQAAESATKAVDLVIERVTQLFTNLTDEFDKLEHDFRDAIEEHQSKVLVDYTHRIGQLRAEYERIVEEFRSSDFAVLARDLKSLLESSVRTVESLRSKTGEMIAQIDRAIPTPDMIANAIGDGVAQVVERNITNFQKNLEDVEKALVESNERIRTTTESLDQITRSAASKLAYAVDASRQSITAAIEGMIGQLYESIPSKDHVEAIIRQGVVGGLEETIVALKRTIVELSGDVASHISAYQATGQQLEVMSVQLTNQITDLLTALGREVRDVPELLRTSLHGYITELTGTVVVNIHDVIEHLIAEIHQRFASFIEKIATATQKIALASSQFDESVKTLLMNLDKSMVQYQRTLYQRLDDIKRTIGETLHAELGTYVRDNIILHIENSTRQYEAIVGKLHQTLQDFLQVLREQSVATTDQLVSLHQRVADLGNYATKQQKDLCAIMLMISVIAVLFIINGLVR